MILKPSDSEAKLISNKGKFVVCFAYKDHMLNFT